MHYYYYYCHVCICEVHLPLMVLCCAVLCCAVLRCADSLAISCARRVDVSHSCAFRDCIETVLMHLLFMWGCANALAIFAVAFHVCLHSCTLATDVHGGPCTDALFICVEGLLCSCLSCLWRGVVPIHVLAREGLTHLPAVCKRVVSAASAQAG